MKKTIRNLAFFAILIGITYYIFFKEQNINDILEILKTVDVKFIWIAIICMCLYLICEAINIGRTIKTLNGKSSMLQNIKYALIGFFFSSITPAASGGQPMQIYYMHKDGISVPDSTLALLINLTCMQIVTISLGILGFIANIQYMNGPTITLFIIGITLNASALVLLLLSIFSKRATKAIVSFCIKVLRFFKAKNIEEKEKKLDQLLEKYQQNSVYVKEHKRIAIRNLITAFIQYFIYYSISYCTYRAFGFKENNIVQIILLQALLYCTVSGIPSPGAVGVSEGGYMMLFEHLYGKGILSGAMLLTRGINFYLFVAISGIVVIINDIKNNYFEKKVEDKQEESEN